MSGLRVRMLRRQRRCRPVEAPHLLRVREVRYFTALQRILTWVRARRMGTESLAAPAGAIAATQALRQARRIATEAKKAELIARNSGFRCNRVTVFPVSIVSAAELALEV